jgi:hypothetical protein
VLPAGGYSITSLSCYPVISLPYCVPSVWHISCSLCLCWLFACSAENPLAVGLAAVAIGALLGLSSRSTTWETQFLGEHVSNYSTRYRILPMN